MRVSIRALLVALPVATIYRLLVRGAVTIDIGIGRRMRPLGPLTLHIAAPRETVFDVIADPYLGRTPRAMADKLRVLERGSDLVLAEHFTPLDDRTTASTLETVRFERPSRIGFRLVRGPVPHVVEAFELEEQDAGTRLSYHGELGTDLWAAGAWWGERVARVWERTVEHSLENIRSEAERRTPRRH